MRLPSALTLLAVTLCSTSGLHAASGGMMVEVFAAGTLEKLQLAQGSWVEDYDQLNLNLRRVSSSWVFYNGECYTTAMYQGYVVSSWATDYIPYTVSNVQVFQAITTKLKHYLHRPVLSLSVSPLSITEGGAATGTITLKNAAGANVSIKNALTINLASNSSRASVPASVVIPMNVASVPFTVSAIDNAIVDGNAAVSLTATAGTWGSTNTSFTVIDND